MDENKFTEQNEENPEMRPDTANSEPPSPESDDFVIGKGFEITEHESSEAPEQGKRRKHSKASSPIKVLCSGCSLWCSAARRAAPMAPIRPG